MKKQNVIKLGVALVLAGAATMPLLDNQGVEKVYVPRSEQNVGNIWKEAAEYLRSMRTEVGTNEINPQLIRSVEKDVATFTKQNQKSALNLQWIEMGPDNVGGRTRAITVDRNAANRLYAGSVSGGLFVSENRGNTWAHIDGFNDNQAIGAMDMTLNGKLVVGTGPIFDGGNGNGGSGFRGNGLYVSDNMVDFTHVTDQNGVPMDYSYPGGVFTTVNEVLADPSNADAVWVATSKGVKHINVNTGAITTPSGTPATTPCTDISVSADGQILLTVFGPAVYRSVDGGATFDRISETNQQGKLPRSGITRVETDISQDDSNFMYALIANSQGQLLNAYGSSDGGDSWIVIMPGSSAPYNTLFGTGQGNYDNVISAVPGKPGECIIGGVTLWRSGVQSQAAQIALNFAPETDPLYVHSDIHEFTWGPEGNLYIGCDGGVHVSDDEANSFYPANRFFNITQFYSTDFSGEGAVIGGTQDNGTQYIDGTGITTESAREVLGGDGFECAISSLNKDVIFGSIYYGAISRSNDGGFAFGGFYDDRILAMGTPGSITGGGLGGFVTSFGFYENENNPNADQYILYVHQGDPLMAGDVITEKSRSGDFPQSHVLTESIEAGDTVFIQDKVESIFCAGFGSSFGIWITRDALKFGDAPQWIRISNQGSGSTRDIEFTADGDHMFYADGSGRVYRVSNLNEVWTIDDGDVELGTNLKTEITQVYNGAGLVTGIAIDPNNKDHVVLTIGGYGGTTHVVESIDATSADPTFESIQGNLPLFPVYDAMIEKNNAARVIVGTEYGIYSTEDGNTWTSENNGFPPVPVFEIEQQWRPTSSRVKNEGTIYAGTHARGIWRSETFTSVGELSLDVEGELKLNVFPNPTSAVANVALDSFTGAVQLSVLDLSGKQVVSEQAHGGTTATLRLGSLAQGTYVVVAQDKTQKLSAKISVKH